MTHPPRGGARPARATQATTSVTSMFPRVAFEYGQTWWATFTKLLHLLARQTRHGNLELHFQSEARRDRADAHRCR